MGYSSIYVYQMMKIPLLFLETFVFSVILILFMIIGETFAILPLLGVIFTILLAKDLLLFNKEKNTVTLPSFLLTVVCWLLTLNIIFSSSIPLSISRMFFLLSGIYPFLTYFSKIAKRQIPIVYQSILMCALVLLVLSTFYTIFQSFSFQLPNMNLLISNYGHNHGNIFFLIGLVISFYFWEKEEFKIHSIFFYLITVFTIGIMLSFGRVSMFLGLLTLLTLLVVSKKRLKKKLSVFFILLSPLIIWISITLVSSFAPTFISKNFCFIPKLQTKVCKYIQNEVRSRYWFQARQGVTTAALTGNGLGTFSLVSTRFKDDYSTFSSYPHNEFLQILSDSGLIIGGLVIVLLSLLYLKILVQLFRTRFSLTAQNTSGIIILLLGFDGFFNYNWNYLSIWWVMLIMIAIYFLPTVPFLSQKKHTPYASSISLFCFVSKVIFGIFLVLYCLFFSLSELAFQYHDYSLAFRLFPFDERRVISYVKNKNLPENDLEIIRKLYKNHSGILTEFANIESSMEQKIQIQKSILERDPLNSFVRAALFEELYAQHRFSELKEQFLIVQSLYSSEKAWMLNQNLGSFKTEALNDINTKKLDRVESLEILHFMYTFDESMLYTDPPALVLTPQNFETSLVDDFIHIKERGTFVPYRKNLHPWYLERIKEKVELEHLDQMMSISEDFVALGDWFCWDVWNVVSPIMSEKIKRANTEGNLSREKELILEWQKMRTHLENSLPSKKFDDEWATDLSEKLKTIEKEPLN